MKRSVNAYSPSPHGNAPCGLFFCPRPIAAPPTGPPRIVVIRVRTARGTITTVIRRLGSVGVAPRITPVIQSPRIVVIRVRTARGGITIVIR